MHIVKKFVSLIVAFATLGLLAGCGASDSEKAALMQTGQTIKNQGRMEGAAEAEAKMDSKWTKARTELRQMGATAASTGKYLIVDNCNVKPDGFSQTQANKDFPSSAFDEFRAGCTAKVHAMKAERDQKKHEGAVAEQKRQAKVAAAKAKQERKMSELKACDSKPVGTKRDACKADVKRRFA